MVKALKDALPRQTIAPGTVFMPRARNKALNACSFLAKNTTGTGMYANATNTGLMPQKQRKKPQILLRAEAYVIYLRNKNIFLPYFPKMEACTGVQGIS